MRANNFKDISGQRFSRLTVIEFAGIGKENRAMWRCKCDCGNEVIVSGKSLRTGNTRSCGCLVADLDRERNEKYIKKHGKTNTRLFGVWSSMKDRCYNKNATSYKDYGMRGIAVCEEWKNDFEAFYMWAMEQGYDPSAKRGECTVDRIDCNKGYSPDNCRLANSMQQADNRRSTRRLTFNGTTMNLSDWARFYGRHCSIFHSMSDDKVIERLKAYEAYKAEHHTDTLPRRIAL